MTDSRSLDPAALDKIRRIAPGMAGAKRIQTSELPLEVAFKLTARCDLRCSHCYQWGEGGHHHQLSRVQQSRDLDLTLIAQVLEATEVVKSNVFLWGGEPLVYRRFGELCDLLLQHQRRVSLCTNGTLLQRQHQHLLKLGSALEVSVSVDGFEAMHDRIRGAGAFQRTLGGLQHLLNDTTFTGELSVNTVLSDDLIPDLDRYVDWIESLGVGTLYLSFPWFLASNTATAMDACVASRFPRLGVGANPSWHGYRHALADRPELRAAVRAIAMRTGPMKLRWNPLLSEEDLAEFLSGSGVPVQKKRGCGAVHSRLDVFPDGEVVSCKFFPEFKMGNLRTASLANIWLGPDFQAMRENLHRCGLMPVCAKCNLLYTRGFS